MEVVPVMVAYHTNAWIRVGIESYLRHFPDDRVLVVNNSPPPGAYDWQPNCEEERYWLGAHPQVIFMENPNPANGRGARGHGAGVDLAAAWCRANGARVMIHLEPDCLVTGTGWRDNLLRALDQGAWMAGGFRQKHGPIHPTPSAWLVAKLHASFCACQWRVPDQADPRFDKLVNLAIHQAYLDPNLWPVWAEIWDTGEKAWFDAAVHDRAVQVETPEFHHYWLGSSARRLPEAALVALFPETEPFFSLARSRVPARRVEQCSFRTDVRQEGEETARCGLLAEASGLEEGKTHRVRRDACEACCACFPPTQETPNPVVASLLFGLGTRLLERGGAAAESPNPAVELQARAAAFLEAPSQQ
jgi:hypothetical protein